MGSLMEPALEVATERATVETKKKTLIESVRNLTETLLTAKQAMEALKIPADKQKEYITLI